MHRRLSWLVFCMIAVPMGRICAENPAESTISALYEQRLQELFRYTKTDECRAMIQTHLDKHVRALLQEEHLPFSPAAYQLESECPEDIYPDFDNLPEGMHIGHIQNRTYQPSHNESHYVSPDNIKLVYAILTHNDPQSTTRLIESLQHPKDRFVVHVDGKEGSDETFRELKEYARANKHVEVLDTRVRVNWGGYSMVNATLQIFQHIATSKHRYHKLVHLASTSYPLASTSEIRQQLASFPVDASLFNVIMKPTRPSPQVWHYFVECDDKLHRITYLTPLTTDTHDAELFTASQWFIASRDYVNYLAEAAQQLNDEPDDEEDDFATQFLRYARHVVVADETVFGTILRNTEFCLKHHNRNYLHLQFDRWESDLDPLHRDERKCMMKDPNHCGRSPTLLTMDYADILELSDDLFARKFDETSSEIKDLIDTWRSEREIAYMQRMAGKDVPRHRELPFEGHGVLMVARDTIRDDIPLCLGLGETGNQLRLTPCFEDWVPPTLAEDWELGGVILRETMPHNRWTFGPCTSDGELRRLDSAEMEVTAGNYSSTGPRCLLKQVDGERAGRCFDGDSGEEQPGGDTHVFPCVNRWSQFVSVGDGRLAPRGSLFFSIPSHLVRQYHKKGHEHIPYMCFGVFGRGNADEEPWEVDQDEYEEDGGNDGVDAAESRDGRNRPALWEGEGWAPLVEFLDAEIITTQCSNAGAVIEWVFIPFIEEESASDAIDKGDSASSDEL